MSSDALGRAIIASPDPPPRKLGHWTLLVPELPGDAWRRVIDFLRFDSTFCHYTVPLFRPHGQIALYLQDEQSEQAQSANDR